METSGVSSKSSLYIFLVSLFILTGIFVLQNISHSSRLYICNQNDYLEAYIRYENRVDILLNPGSDTKAVLECISQGMPFYDRSIEYIIGGSYRVQKELQERYTIDKILTKGKSSIGEYDIEIVSSYIHISKADRSFLIFKYAQKALYSPNKGGLLIRPRSVSSTIERLLQEPHSLVINRNGRSVVKID
jgi:hypothetical protein